MATSIGTLSAKVTANGSSFSATMVKCQKDADALATSLRDQRLQLEMGDAQFERYKMRLAGVSDETINAIAAERQQIEMLKQQQQAMVTLTTAQGTATGSSGRMTFAIQQLAFGAQDAATVMGTSGFSGAIRASSNNVIQFASLLHPLAGTITALAGTAIAVWADSMAKADDKQSGLTKTVEMHEERLRKLIDTIKEAGRLQQQWAKIGQADKAAEAKTNAESLQRDVDQLKAEQEQLGKVKAKFKEIDDARQKDAKQLLDDEERQRLALQDPRMGGGKEIGIFNRLFGDTFSEQRKKLEEEQAKSAEQHKELAKEQERIEKDLREKTAMLEEAKRKEKELKDKEAAENAAKLAEKEAEKKIKEAERAAKEAEKLAQDQERFRDKLDREGARKGEKAVVKAMQELKDLDELGFNAQEHAALQQQIFDNAWNDINDLSKPGKKGGKDHSLAGAAEFGSKEAFSRVAAQFGGGAKDTVDEKLAAQLEVAREQLKELRDARRNNKIEPKVVAF